MAVLLLLVLQGCTTSEVIFAAADRKAPYCEELYEIHEVTGAWKMGDGSLRICVKGSTFESVSTRYGKSDETEDSLFMVSVPAAVAERREPLDETTWRGLGVVELPAERTTAGCEAPGSDWESIAVERPARDRTWRTGWDDVDQAEVFGLDRPDAAVFDSFDPEHPSKEYLATYSWGKTIVFRREGSGEETPRLAGYLPQHRRGETGPDYVLYLFLAAGFDVLILPAQPILLILNDWDRPFLCYED